MTDTVAEVIWLRRLLVDMVVSLRTPTPLYCDNLNDIKIDENLVLHEGTKYI